MTSINISDNTFTTSTDEYAYWDWRKAFDLANLLYAKHQYGYYDPMIDGNDKPYRAPR